MLRPDATAASALLAGDPFADLGWPRAAATASGPRGPAYAPLAAEVSREIHEFIENGSALASWNASPQARWLATQAARSAPEPAAVEEAGAAPDAEAAQPLSSLGTAQRAFLARIEPWAKTAASALGVAPEVVQAHAALESGWGRRPLTTASGEDSHNLFSLKASPAWRGEVVSSLTTEYEDGVAVKRTEAFRRYGDLGEAFGDYVRLLSTSGRYRGALHTGGNAAAFAQALANGGYATDPAYARKLTRMAEQIAAAR